jgi:hypothetical protein
MVGLQTTVKTDSRVDYIEMHVKIEFIGSGSSLTFRSEFKRLASDSF